MEQITYYFWLGRNIHMMSSCVGISSKIEYYGDMHLNAIYHQLLLF